MVVVVIVVVAVLLARLVLGKIGSVVVPFLVAVSTNKNCFNYLIISPGMHLSMEWFIPGILNCSIKI